MFAPLDVKGMLDSQIFFALFHVDFGKIWQKRAWEPKKNF